MITSLKPVPAVKPSSLRIRGIDLKVRRSWLARSLGCHYNGMCVPINDPSDQYSLARGVCRRLLLETPVVDKSLLREFRTFVRRYLHVVSRRYGLMPLSSIKTFDEWIDGLNHPDWRKSELRAAKVRVDEGVDPRARYKNKFHGKVEHLEGPKENRGINARVDEAKVEFGPAISSIEAEVYSKIPEFAKHIPVCELPARIAERCQVFGADKVVATDYTSFEGHFCPELIRACEGQLYHYMLKCIDPGLAARIVSVIGGTNVCESKLLTFSVEGCRMSGDMMTSLGNGFTNLMIFKFLSRKCGFEHEGFIEGDDGLFLVRGAAPDSSWYSRLGFNVKIDIHTDPSTASFCGQVFDSGTGDIVIDPVYTALTIGWTMSDQRHSSPRKLLGLLRAKAISLAYQAPGCPVVGALVRALMRLTEGVDPIDPTYHGAKDWWTSRLLGDNVVLSERILDKLRLGPTDRSRQIMEEVYHVAVAEQHELEEFFLSWSSLRPWSHPVIDRLAKPSYREYFRCCFAEFEKGSDMSAPFGVDYDHWDAVDVRGVSWKWPCRGEFDESVAHDSLDQSVLDCRWGGDPLSTD